MRIYDLNWMQLEEYLQHDNRAALPLGSVEQHAYLSLGTDAVLSERVALEAAEPLGVPVFPALPYGITPYFGAFPGSLSLRTSTYLAILNDLLNSLYTQGFHRILLVNGHGGNIPVSGLVGEWLAEHPKASLVLHNWWNAPGTWAEVKRVDSRASHASWMENFPWTRLPEIPLPSQAKPLVDVATLKAAGPQQVRRLLVDGSYGGRYQRSNEEMMGIWHTAVEETRKLLLGPWPG